MLRADKISLLLCVVFTACAAALPQDRRDYILARSHGWAELTVHDVDVPFLPPSKEKPDEPLFPSTCQVEVFLDNESFLSSYAYPFGEEEPFRVDTGFRFPAPIGLSHMRLSYSGCDVTNGKATSVDIETEIQIYEDFVTEIHFNGNEITVDHPRTDSVVTLEDVYEAVTGRPKADVQL